MKKIWQEFFCNDCGGYFRVKLNMALNINVEVVCPECGRKHPRVVENGRIYEKGNSSGVVEEIHTTKSAYSKEPLHKNIQPGARDGKVIESDADLIRDAYVRELWTDHYGGRD